MMVMNCFYYSVGDVISGMLGMKKILETYGILLEDGEKRLGSLHPLYHVEQLVKDFKDSGGVVDN